MKIGTHSLCENFPGYIKSLKAIEESAYDRAWLAKLGVTEISSAYLDNEFEQIGRVGKCGK